MWSVRRAGGASLPGRHDMATANGEHQVIFMPSGRRGQVRAGETLLDAARQLGVEIESICGGRLTCAKCRVRIEEGQFAKHGIASAATHVSPSDAREASLLAEAANGDGAYRCLLYTSRCV